MVALAPQDEAKEQESISAYAGHKEPLDARSSLNARSSVKILTRSTRITRKAESYEVIMAVIP
ncbi:hypothetical protein [Mesotoga sp. UBA5557]|jgi:hypothetical protein|uniref:hypothetical protein n=1 Tax=Mesotoga sp. UBA5557 TaxID=1946857 RepID=UPI0025FF0DB1|nr:hypothetical protein [Mesotoga sp. UBA5557]